MLRTAFIGSIARGLSLIAIFIGGLMFAFGEGGSKLDNGPGSYPTALHELGHWTGHPDRLNRPTLIRDMEYGELSQEYAREELRAEISSLITGNRIGLGHDPPCGDGPSVAGVPFVPSGEQPAAGLASPARPQCRTRAVGVGERTGSGDCTWS